jgi:photosystem II stability/assembly factor-like uncharacterized protein
MLKTGITFILITCSLVNFAATSTAYSESHEVIWKDISNGIRGADLNTVAVNSDDPGTSYISSDDAVYKSIDGGKRWKEVMSLRATANGINTISLASESSQIIYAGTKNGLFRSNDGGSNWNRIFAGIGRENSVLTVATSPGNPDIIYIGTEGGLFSTENNGKSWSKGRIPSSAGVHSIAIDYTEESVIYASTGNGLYKKMNRTSGWEKVLELKLYYEASEYLNDIESGDINEIGSKSNIKSVLIDPLHSDSVYVATSRGLFVTTDRGGSWTRASDLGLISRNIQHIIVESEYEDSIFAATDRGVFMYSKSINRWEELYRGLVSLDIRHLDISSNTANGTYILWAATDGGVYKSIPVKYKPKENIVQQSSGQLNKILKVEDALSMFSHEPSIEEIREAAIIYAEVHPEKIVKWRKAASKRAWLPDLRVAYDKNKDWQSSTYFYSTSSQKYTNDDITSGKDDGWSVSLTWELGDIVWNNDQTSIDSRSRLMVQLRDDVLNEVTRLYFERRRLQVEALLSGPQDIADKIENELRLQELTASIDAITGSYMLKRLNHGPGVIGW